MSNRIKRMQKRIKRIPDTGEVKYNHEIMVHGKMVYECEKCGRRWNMYLEKGLEEFERDHKPTPFVIRCRCGGPAKDISGIIKFAGGGYYPLPEGESYFANRKDSDCGIPVLC